MRRWLVLGAVLLLLVAGGLTWGVAVRRRAAPPADAGRGGGGTGAAGGGTAAAALGTGAGGPAGAGTASPVLSAQVYLGLPTPLDRLPQALRSDDPRDQAVLRRLLTWIAGAAPAPGEISPPDRSAMLVLRLADGTRSSYRLAYDCTTSQVANGTMVQCRLAPGQVIYQKGDAPPVRLFAPDLALWLQQGWQQDVRFGPPDVPPWLTALSTAGGQRAWVGGVLRGCQGYEDRAGWCRGVIYGTDDGGGHWQRLYLGEVAPLSLSFVSAREGWAAGAAAAGDAWQDREGKEEGVLLHTTDGGVTWTPIYRAPGGPFRYVQFLDAGTGYLANPQGLWRSDDGGKSWQFVNPAGCSARWPDEGCTFGFLDAAHGFEVRFGGSGAGDQSKALLRTDDGGRHWTPVQQSGGPGEHSTGLPFSGYVSSLAFRTAGDGWLAMSRGGLWATHDGGATWQQVGQVGNQLAGAATAVAFASPERGYAILGEGAGSLAATEDAGRTWRLLTLPGA